MNITILIVLAIVVYIIMYYSSLFQYYNHLKV